MAMTPEEALKAAIRIVGSKSEMAREVGKSSQALGQWKRCPPQMALKVMAAVDRAKARAAKAPTLHDLCPEVYPPGMTVAKSGRRTRATPKP